MTQEAVIVSAVRTAVGKAPRGTLRNVRPEAMAAAVVAEAVRRAEGLDPAQIEDVIIGCAFPEGKQGMQIGRIAALAAGLPDSVPGQTVNRFCASGLQTIALAAERIIAGFADCIVAGGVESMSAVPMGGHVFAADPRLALEYPAVYTGMGLTAENVAAQYRVSREDQDAFALESHRRAAAAIRAGRFAEEIVPLPVTEVWVDEDGRVQRSETVFTTDEGVRFDTSAE
ncbi:MAG: acetyl-CoA C-acyltransferase, partial [Caldilineales bacterium]|nr:acetyl-CoA C-acyltransferase [Caldilineales bacterium]